MSTRRLALGALFIAVLAFGSGYLAGDYRATHPPILTGDGYVGADQASLQVGDTWYGFSGPVLWTDVTGGIHQGDWPTCLPQLQSVTGIRFAAMKAFADDTGTEEIFWVDCRGH